ncbi:helix-turn-helix domain-containing protein [Streptomyces spectabilis]|uniref:Excisionase family DNA binding protein n=1 Tax=Streptomyces spectabilis TaxID=68270 RepID=A0A7W8B5Z3_STRST|nr:helix-turn-helix domain-containing protein [Streptomyces spectabilis]MBB5109193.1 excisionase family DNA binding protein [Streptomyces spectabilis]MCI3907750.1 helix-turn-helix domain-containing protein [Streptomyces spectabilis]GGV51297.1 hypothetical protein GCM10010245_80840 [Streptomyces spectabilis]
MLRVKEVAAALGVHPATVYRLIKDGELEAVRSGRPRKQGTKARGGAIRIPPEALEAHLSRAAIATGM